MTLTYSQLELAIENEDADLFSQFLEEEHRSKFLLYLDRMICYNKIEEAKRLIMLMKITDPERLKNLVSIFISNASGFASKAMLKLALDSGGDINRKSVAGDTALMKYLWHVDEPVVKLLLKHKPDLNIENNHGETAIFILLESWPEEYFEKFKNLFVDFVKLGANIHHRNNKQQTLLHCATYQNDSKAIKFLLEQGLDINAQDESGNTALLIALAENSAGAANALLDGGADVTLQNSRGDTALTICSKSKGLKSVKNKLRKIGHSIPDQPVLTSLDEIIVAENMLDKFRAIQELLSENNITIDKEASAGLSNEEAFRKFLNNKCGVIVEIDKPDELGIFNILNLLIPNYGLCCPVEPFGSFKDEELITVYSDVFHDLNGVLGIDGALCNIQGELGEDITLIKFEYSGSQYEFEYSHNSKYLDYKLLEDIENFAEINLPGRFLVDFQAETIIQAFYLPKKAYSIMKELLMKNYC